jgi:hypothetical protein
MTVTPTTATANDAARVQREMTRLDDVTGKVVGSVFFGTLLRSMRQSEMKGAYGHGGRGEEVFAGQLHGIYAEQVGRSMRGGLKEALLDRLARQQELMTRQRPTPPTTKTGLKATPAE